MKTATKSYISIAATLIAALAAGCSESPEEQVYQAFKCAKAATMLGEDADAQMAMRNTDHLLSKINTGGSPARYGMEMGARFQEEVPLYANGREGQFQLLIEVYESGRCKALYRKQSAPSGQVGIPEYVPGEEPSTMGAAGSSDGQIDQTVVEGPASQAASPGEVVIDAPMLGSAANETTGDITRPTQVFRQEDMIYLRVPYRGAGSAEHTLSTKWTFNGESGDVPVHEASKVIHADGDLAALFYMEYRNARASGRYTVEVQVDGQTMRAASFTVAEPMQLGSGMSQEDTVTPERPIPVPRCPPAVSDLERAMCRDSGLVALDKKLSELHRKAQATTNDVWELDQEQGKWRRDRRDPCRDDIACLTAAYQERIDALSP